MKYMQICLMVAAFITLMAGLTILETKPALARSGCCWNVCDCLHDPNSGSTCYYVHLTWPNDPSQCGAATETCFDYCNNAN